jgi:hypothetical protein
MPPKAVRSRAEAARRSIATGGARAEAVNAFGRCIEVREAEYDAAVDRLERDRYVLFALPCSSGRRLEA